MTWDEGTKAISAIASLLGALAWPFLVFYIVIYFRSEIRLVLEKIPALLGGIKDVEIAGVKVRLEQAADRAGEEPSGVVTPQQVEAAAQVVVEASDDRAILLRELDRLCLEYDAIRRSMGSSNARTQAMTRVVVKMRILAPSLSEFIDAYKVSGSAGSRLAAVAMMQMNSELVDLGWLLKRFNGDAPFIFYHAALALQNFATETSRPDEKRRVCEIAETALGILNNFKGEVDRATVDVLKALVASISNDTGTAPPATPAPPRCPRHDTPTDAHG